MILPKFNIDPADGSVVAVVVGAFLATTSGFVATQIENYNRRRDKERSAALLFGEILVGVKLTIGLADRTRGRGDPYGPVTMRMVRAAQREAQTYERNRESLFDLRNPALRAHIHMLFARMIIALDGTIDASREVASAETTMRMLPPSDPVAGGVREDPRFLCAGPQAVLRFRRRADGRDRAATGEIAAGREILFRSPRSRRARHGSAASHGRIAAKRSFCAIRTNEVFNAVVAVVSQWPQ